MEDFIACFAYVRDLRQENALHNLHEIPDDRTMLYAAQREDCSDIAFGRAKEPFLRQFLTLKHGIPSHDTFSRGSKGSMKGKHKQAGWNDAFLIRCSQVSEMPKCDGSDTAFCPYCIAYRVLLKEDIQMDPVKIRVALPAANPPDHAYDRCPDR
jgi:hypothetical protein